MRYRFNCSQCGKFEEIVKMGVKVASCPKCGSESGKVYIAPKGVMARGTFGESHF